MEILRLTGVGAFLGSDPTQAEEAVLLPQKWLPPGAELGQSLEVFVYYDHELRPIATTQMPLAQRDDFAFLRVKQVSGVGAFLDWGLEKDLLVPFAEQKEKMQEGKHYVVQVYLDELSGRLAATARLQRCFDREVEGLKLHQELDILTVEESELGWLAVVNNRYQGLLYHNEIYEKIYPGERRKAYLKQVRSDGKLDLLLQKPGYDKVDQYAQSLLDKLRAEGGFLALHDKSSPEDIAAHLPMSKKLFKKALGSLYRQRLIDLEEEGISLVSTK